MTHNVKTSQQGSKKYATNAFEFFLSLPGLSCAWININSTHEVKKTGLGKLDGECVTQS